MERGSRFPAEHPISRPEPLCSPVRSLLSRPPPLPSLSDTALPSPFPLALPTPARPASHSSLMGTLLHPVAIAVLSCAPSRHGSGVGGLAAHCLPTVPKPVNDFVQYAPTCGGEGPGLPLSTTTLTHGAHLAAGSLGDVQTPKEQPPPLVSWLGVKEKSTPCASRSSRVLKPRHRQRPRRAGT